jgi:hypothetical protein
VSIPEVVKEKLGRKKERVEKRRKRRGERK